MSADEVRPLPFVELPRVCGACVNACLADATANPLQDMASVYCPHGESLITARIADHGDKRCVHCWSISGPMSAEQAAAAIRQAARAAGAATVDNSRVTH